MSRRVAVVERVDASPQDLERLISARGASWDMDSPVQAGSSFHVEAAVAEDGLRMAATYDARVPYWNWVFGIPLRLQVRGVLRHLARALSAEATGAPPPPEPKRPAWAPPDHWDAAQSLAVGTIAFLLAIAGYCSGLFSQNADYVAKTFHATDAQLGVLLAITRVGNLLVLVGGVLADRAGRRKLLLWSVAITVVASILSGVAPTFAIFDSFQVIVNGASNLAFLVGFIAAVEQAPEASRAWTLAIVGVATGTGYAVAAILLPLSDLTSGAWRVQFLLSVVGLIAMPGVTRNLMETSRFKALEARDANRGRIGEVVDDTYGGRFAVLAVVGFLLAFNFAPTGQLLNRYLSDERGFNGFRILLLRAATQGIIGLAAALIGGRVSEAAGRRPVAIWGTLVSSVVGAFVFLIGGPILWLALGISSASGSFAAPALGTFGNELFPTEVRGTAGAGLTVIGVLGSASGLLTVGFLSHPLGSLGKALALTTVAPVLVALLLLPRLPEARGRLLDEVSPPEV